MSGLEEMHKYSIDERLYEFFEFKPFKTIEDTQNYIKKLLNERMSYNGNKKRGMYWFIRRSSDKKLIGTASLTNIQYSRKSIEWGYGIDPNLWGYGYILKIQEILKKYVFEELSFNRLHGITMLGNEKTISSILSCGMTNEGIVRDYYFKDGKYIDGWMYSMLKKEYFNQKKSIINTGFEINENKILKIISSIITEEEININSDMNNTYSWDSLTHLFILTKISDEIEIKFTPSEVADANSVKSIISIIKNKT